MRTIFITPIFWKRYDRATIRRGEEGQALVLIALVIVAVIAMVGLAIDGALSYLEATRMQRAADAAALSGVQWLPDNRPVADARARLGAEAQGVKVACDYDAAKTAAYNDRCKGATIADVQANGPGARYYYESEVPVSSVIQFRVKICKMQGRVFLGVIGFPNYLLCRQAIAEYARLVKFGSSFNYFGTLGVMYDHYMRCDMSSKNNCDTQGGLDLSMYGATYQRYILMRCDQTPAPKPNCVGGFWGSLFGPSFFHSNGDAYNGIRDGAGSVGGARGPLSTPTINSGGTNPQCLGYQDPNSWFVTTIFTDPAVGTTCNPKNASNIPALNFDKHPDSPGGQKGFGYEIGIEVVKDAIYQYSETVLDISKHTNLNITVYDGAMGELGSGQDFQTGDSYQGGGSLLDQNPYSTFAFQNQLAVTATWSTKQLVCSPGTTFACIPAAKAAVAGVPGVPSRITDTNSFKQYVQLFPDSNNLELTKNDFRTRFTLYGPPSVPAIPSTYGNVSGLKIGAFETSDMSVRYTGASNIQQPIENGDYTRYCYVMFDDAKAAWDNTRLVGASSPYLDNIASNKLPPSSGGTGPDYAYTLVAGVPQYGSPLAQTQRYAYVCPQRPNGTGFDRPNDFRFNQLKGTNTARYGTFFAPANQYRTIQYGILDATKPNDIAANPVVSGTLRPNNAVVSSAPGTSTVNADPSQQGQTSIWNPKTANFDQPVDTSQDCRRSAIDADGWPIDPLWGHNRIPFNMAYGDPLVNRAWITDTSVVDVTGLTNPVALGRIAGYYTLYYSFHGWRCDWDFDGNYTFNPKQPPGDYNSPSLSIAERSLGAPGQWDRAFALAHPGLVSNARLTAILQAGSDPAPAAAINKEILPLGNSPIADKDFGLQPYFHLTNLAWVTGTLGADLGKSNENADVRPGTYMLHVQAYGGGGVNRYSVKAEYENAKNITYVLASKNVTVKPVPNVYAITAMSLYTNARNTAAAPTQNIIFDLAFIPPDNAGTQAILELWDAGDVGGSGTLGIEVLPPSRYGPKVKTNGDPNPANWTLPVAATPLKTRITVCPYSITVDSLGLAGNCTTDSSGVGSTTQLAYDSSQGGQFYNDQWMLLSFTLPSTGDYNDMKRDCETNGVPEPLCYYFQINYKLTGASMSANDTTTWQLVVQGQPVHLVD